MTDVIDITGYIKARKNLYASIHEAEEALEHFRKTGDRTKFRNWTEKWKDFNDSLLRGDCK